jgi:hypothetical protein
MAMAQRPINPTSKTEIQAVITLKAARDVAEDIEGFRNALKNDRLSARQRARLKDDLLEAAERLCNLLDLLISWISMVSESIREPLSEGIQDMRDRLLATGIKLIGDKAQRLLDQAKLSMDGGFPLGLSFRMSEAAVNLNSTVEALGGFDSMPAPSSTRTEMSSNRRFPLEIFPRHNLYAPGASQPHEPRVSPGGDSSADFLCSREG